MKKILIIVVSVVIVLVVGSLLLYNISLSPVSSSTNKIEVIVEKGSTYLSVADVLKEENLIKSKLAYKIYIKLNSPKALEAGKYELSESMSVKEIVTLLEKGSDYNDDTITLTIPEGRHIADVADLASKITNNSASDLITLWDSQEFIDKVINKYWFVTNEVRKKDIKHPLEGYFFPSTYELLNEDVDGEYIAFKLLDQMKIVLDKYKDEIEDSEYSVHEVLTLASIVEHEAILDKDRPIIAGVFYNRLKKDMLLQSCATVGYAIDEWKLSYSSADLNVNSPYNTYYYAGLPIGPGNLPSEESLKATLNPDETEYLYFIADVCHDGYGVDDKVYYSKTFEQHESYIAKYLTCY